MTTPCTLWIGTSAHGTWYSRDLGETWERPTSRSGMYLEAGIFALSAHPGRPGEILAGTSLGLYRWLDSEERWHAVPSPMDRPDCSIWSIGRDPADPARILAGTRPCAFYGSEDEGRTWKTLHVPEIGGDGNPTRASRGYGDSKYMRVTTIQVDPADPDTLWAGIEIDAVHVSRDRGGTWERLSEGLVSDDIHDLAILDTPGGRRMLAATNKGLHRSDDGGRRWRVVELGTPWPYTRTMTLHPSRDGTVFLTNGNGPPGSTGRLLRSRTWGDDDWEEVPLPGRLNSTVWVVAANPADPSLLFTCSNLGQVFRSTDGGGSWTRIEREFGDIRSMLWVPR